MWMIDVEASLACLSSVRPKIINAWQATMNLWRWGGRLYKSDSEN